MGSPISYPASAGGDFFFVPVLYAHQNTARAGQLKPPLDKCSVALLEIRVGLGRVCLVDPYATRTTGTQTTDLHVLLGFV